MMFRHFESAMDVRILKEREVDIGDDDGQSILPIRLICMMFPLYPAVFLNNILMYIYIYIQYNICDMNVAVWQFFINKLSQLYSS